MSYLVLARKYRPQSFDQVVQQEHVVRTLTNAIAMDRMSHAVLFAGPRGTGKTTVARILAKAMNCLQGPTPTPCNQCRSCREITAGSAVDVYEIDGASNNGVEHVRDLRDNLRYMPAHSTYKIYIIDEVHMLSAGAFNALLKTLEEPPAHVMFIFATTEPHKIPATILSRCQRHDFRRIDTAAVSAHLLSICRSEGRKMDEFSAGLIAREAGGSIRDALSLLDHALACVHGEITNEQLVSVLGVIDRHVVYDLAAAMCRADLPAILDLVNQVYDRGWDLKRFYAEIIQHIRDLLVIRIARQPQQLVDLPASEIAFLQTQVRSISGAALAQVLEFLCQQEQAVRFAANARLAVEMIMVRLAQLQPVLPIDELIGRLEDLRRQTGSAAPDSAAIPIMPNDASGHRPPAPVSDWPPAGQASARPPDGAVAEPPDPPDTLWAKLLKVVSKDRPSLAAVLSKARLKEVGPDKLVMETAGGDFQMKLIQQNLAIIGSACQQVTGRPMAVSLASDDARIGIGPDQRQCSATPAEPTADHPAIAAVLDTLGGKVLEIKTIRGGFDEGNG
jgi:DNA polymerase-3 subunit gamma/tau